MQHEIMDFYQSYNILVDFGMKKFFTIYVGEICSSHRLDKFAIVMQYFLFENGKYCVTMLENVSTLWLEQIYPT